MERIGRYELRDKLGQGGMGVVYRAYDTLLERIVAVKLISGTIEENPDLRERFFREARAAGQLSHRNIITIHDLGEHEGLPYLAMEYLDGEDLQRRMAGHDRLSLAHKLDLAIEICEGLEFAHAHNVIHRDIKPANIFITDYGRVKLLDFGLARLVTSELTHSNMMMGTINYMAPEQVRGERADHRSDVFATGVVIYEMLSGRKAFQGDSFAATLYQILQQVPEPLDRIDPSLPWQMVAIVERALAKPRDERYQSIGDMLRDLIAVRQQQQLSDAPTGYRSAIGTGPLSPLPQLAPGSGALSQRPASGGPGSRPGAEPNPPLASQPVPLLTPTPSPVPLTAPVTPAARPSRGVLAAGAAALVVALAVGAYYLNRPAATLPPQATAPSAPPAAVPEDQAVQAAVTGALNAFQSANYAEALRLADRVLLQSPNHPEARRIADRSREATATIERGLQEARASYQAGRYDDAVAAAGSVLSVAPCNSEAKKLMDDSTSRSRGRAVEDARNRAIQARSAAVAAGAPSVAANAFGAAVAAEREAARLQRAGRTADAAAKFYEAGGLFRSAEVAALTAGALARQRATLPAPAQTERAQPPAAPPVTEPSPSPTVPSIPVAPIEKPPAAATVPVPAPPQPTASPAPAPPAATPPAAAAPPATPSPEAAIREVLTRYELALESRSMEALKRVWPSLGGAQQAAIRNEFDHASRIDVDIIDPRISVNGAAATVLFLRHYELQTTDRQTRRADTPATMTLRRADGGWIIDQIRFDAAR
jgi:serine/threonine protein kinase